MIRATGTRTFATVLLLSLVPAIAADSARGTRGGARVCYLDLAAAPACALPKAEARLR